MPVVYPIPTYPFDNILSFCYALLAPGQNANLIIASNPEKVREYHRAIYDRQKKTESYDDMMERTNTLDSSDESEKLAQAVELLRRQLPDLNTAANPMKSDVYVISGTSSRLVHDAIKLVCQRLVPEGNESPP